MKRFITALSLIIILSTNSSVVFAENNIPDYQSTLDKAEQGHAYAQAALGSMYLLGQGVRQDYVQAFKWHTKSAEQGNAHAQFLLGVMYADGKGVRQNKTIAKEWFGQACDNGNQTGCDNYKRLNQ